MSLSPRHGLALLLPALVALTSIGNAPAADLPGHIGAWEGIYPTVVTPFQGTTGGVNTAALDRQLVHLTRAGVNGLVVCDHFGEGEYLSPEERGQVIQGAVRRAFPHIPVVVGIHARDMDEARRQALEARRLGASAALVEFPGRPGASASDVCTFMRGLGEIDALPLFYDHCPARTGVNLNTTEMAHLLATPGVVGVRDAASAVGEVEAHSRLCRGMKRVIFTASGLDLVPFLKAGGCGAMCPEAVLLPVPAVQAYRAYGAGRHEEARVIQQELLVVAPLFRPRPAVPVLECVAYVTGQDSKHATPAGPVEPQAQMKAALTCLGVETPTLVKMPLTRLSPADLRCVSSTITTVKRIDWCEVSMRVPPEPVPAATETRAGGMLLKTGAFLLGPGVSKDLLHTVNDGQSGFFP